MPRYDIKCLECQNETIYYFQREVQVEFSDIPCEECGSQKTELIAFYEDEQSQIMQLQKEIDNLIEVVDALIDRMGYNDSAEVDVKRHEKIH